MPLELASKSVSSQERWGLLSPRKSHSYNHLESVCRLNEMQQRQGLFISNKPCFLSPRKSHSYKHLESVCRLKESKQQKVLFSLNKLTFSLKLLRRHILRTHRIKGSYDKEWKNGGKKIMATGTTVTTIFIFTK